ncbi:UDP-glucose 4-epimerase GalE [Desulfofundulus salinus]|uniref:UDP-glucose 4-epimerase n=1 Tax=Desulfofundulus salinus TaxID=2419843 RepID=A0A494WU83_9FIRM|nr:UDP-glucose 4-epimerase GalE [Desulfofundulus salinum]RKO66948.1 UDP-glucose 4-epimerase GalE [Desulfofundulus salinum]
MHILVTGGAGYIGSHTVQELLRAGYRVTVLDNLSRGHMAVAQVLDGAEFVWGDIADRELVVGLVRSRGIQAVLHFAALSLVGESMAEPSLYYHNNVVKGLSLLEAVREAEVPYFIFSSTAAVYGEPVQVPIEEDHPLAPTNPYGATKLAFEEALRWYGAAYGIKYVSLRYFNASGADPEGGLGEDHQPETHLIPLVLQAALGLRPEVTVFGTDYPTPDGTCIRDYIHVTDLAEAHVLALRALEGGLVSGAYNLGNERGYSVREVVEVARRVTGRDFPVVEGARRPGDPAVLVASSRRIREELGWRPRYGDLETIVRTAWEWHRRHPEGYEGGT